MKAYFEEGVDLSQQPNLIKVAVRAGLSGEKVEELLADNSGLAEIERSEKELQQLGIAGVPFYILNNKHGISGAQPTATFVQAFQKLALTESNV